MCFEALCIISFKIIILIISIFSSKILFFFFQKTSQVNNVHTSEIRESALPTVLLFKHDFLAEFYQKHGINIDLVSLLGIILNIRT